MWNCFDSDIFFWKLCSARRADTTTPASFRGPVDVRQAWTTLVFKYYIQPGVLFSVDVYPAQRLNDWWLAVSRIKCAVQSNPLGARDSIIIDMWRHAVDLRGDGLNAKKKPLMFLPKVIKVEQKKTKSKTIHRQHRRFLFFNRNQSTL